MSDTPTQRACCAIGARADVATIDEALRAGEGLGTVAKRFGLVKGTLGRHRLACLGIRAETGPETVSEVSQDRPTPEPATPKIRPETGVSGVSDLGFGVLSPGDDPMTSPRKVIAAELEARAVALRAKGKSYLHIAEELGVSAERAMDAVERVLLRTRRGADEKADAARRLDLERVDQLLAGLWDRATDPSMATVDVPADTETGVRAYDGQDKAVDRVTKLLERRAKLLGLDVPTAVTQINFYGSPDWQRIRDVILAALMPFPDAMAAVIAAMERSMRGGPDGGGEPVMMPSLAA